MLLLLKNAQSFRETGVSLQMYDTGNETVVLQAIKFHAFCLQNCKKGFTNLLLK